MKKYQLLVARRTPTSKSSSLSASEDMKYSKKFNHPLKYDKRWRFNFLYKPNKQNTGSTYDLHGKEDRMGNTLNLLNFNKFERFSDD